MTKTRRIPSFPALSTSGLASLLSVLRLHMTMLIQYSPKPHRPSPEEYINPPTPDPTRAGPPPTLPAGYGRWREYKYDPNAVVIPAPAWAEGGSLAGWRAGGILSSNARTGGAYGGGGDRNSGASRGGGGGGGGGGGFTKDLSTILCFVSSSSRHEVWKWRGGWLIRQRCNQHGHFANACPNSAVPGDRGGLKRQ